MFLETKTRARSILRKAKLTGVAHRIRLLWHRDDYEDRFADVMLASIRPDDCVWDIGANVGFYTERFSQLAKHVVAFEPVSENCAKIESRGLSNVECLQIALGDTARDTQILVNGPFSSVVNVPSPGDRLQRVKLARGDDLSTLSQPTIVKIDVEGFELEVVRGMHKVLSATRALFIEVHFGILEDRGMLRAPVDLIKDLKRLGFSRIEWPDASHIAAFRSATLAGVETTRSDSGSKLAEKAG